MRRRQNNLPPSSSYLANPAGRLKLGSLLADMGRRAKLTDEEFAVFEQVRNKAPTRPVSFE